MTNTNVLHKQLNLLKINDIYKINVLIIVHNSKYAKSPMVIKKMFQTRYTPYNTRNRNNLNTNAVKTKYGESTISYKGSELWNSLDPNIKCIVSSKTFRGALTKLIVNNYQ